MVPGRSLLAVRLGSLAAAASSWVSFLRVEEPAHFREVRPSVTERCFAPRLQGSSFRPVSTFCPGSTSRDATMFSWAGCANRVEAQGARTIDPSRTAMDDAAACSIRRAPLSWRLLRVLFMTASWADGPARHQGGAVVSVRVCTEAGRPGEARIEVGESPTPSPGEHEGIRRSAARARDDGLHLEGATGRSDRRGTSRTPKEPVSAARSGGSLQGRQTLVPSCDAERCSRRGGVAARHRRDSPQLALLTGDPEAWRGLHRLPLRPGSKAEVEFSPERTPLRPEQAGSYGTSLRVEASDFGSTVCRRCSRAPRRSTLLERRHRVATVIRGRARFADSAYNWS